MNQKQSTYEGNDKIDNKWLCCVLQQRDPKALGRVLWTKPLVFKYIWDLVTFSGFLGGGG